MSLDYTPEPGAVPLGVDLSHGIIRSTHGGRTNTVDGAIVRRLSPHRSGVIDAFDHEVLLPRQAATNMRNLVTLVRTYEAQLLPSQRDLLGVTTVRFDPDLAHHRAWEMGRQFVRETFNARGLLALMVHHVPALAARRHKPHLHILWPVRILGQEFGRFVVLDKATLAAEWQRIVTAQLA